MSYIIQCGGRPATAWRSIVLLAVLGLTTACRQDDPLPTGPRVATPSGPLVAIEGANVTDLPFVAVAINDAGQVAGTQNPGVHPLDQPPARAMLYTPGVGVQDLGTLGGTRSEAYALNEQGQVVGYSTTAFGVPHAFLWTPGVGMQEFDAFGLNVSVARGINDRGEVVGEETVVYPTTSRNPETHAFLWTPAGGMQVLPALGGELTSSVAYDINNAGQVVGRSYSADRIIPPDPGSDPEYFSHAFLWTPGQGMKDLGGFGVGYAVAYAINDAGLVVGKSWVSTVLSEEYGYSGRAVLWEPGQAIRDLGGLWAGPHNSAAYGINEAGQVVGGSDMGIAFRDGVSVQAFLWSAADGMESLFPTTGLNTAQGINNHQQVVGDRRIATLHLVPGNDRPVASIGGPYTGTEGTPVELIVSVKDNSDVGFTYTLWYGDGSTETRLTSRGITHRYADNGTYALTLNVRDSRGASDTKYTTVTIANVAPAILAGSLTGPASPIPLAAGRASAPISFEFSDMGGKHDGYTAVVACGNGVVVTAHDVEVFETYNQNGDYLGGRGTYRGACTYTSAGFYTVTARVSDEDGGTSGKALFSDVIVFDPAGSTRGSSTRGSGFYSVPGQGNRKAHFTFDASFPGGGTVPNGAVRFWIPGLEKNFESSTIELLVVSGNRAQFWGTGTLNGAPARFRITAVDGNAHHEGVDDAIRVQLWDASGATLLYDTQPGAPPEAAVTTPIDGGNIQIRRG